MSHISAWSQSAALSFITHKADYSRSKNKSPTAFKTDDREEFGSVLGGLEVQLDEGHLVEAEKSEPTSILPHVRKSVWW